MHKADSPFRPFEELGIDVFGNESNMPRMAYKAVFFRGGHWGGDYKNRVAVRRCNSRPSRTALKLNIISNTESELVYVKPKARVLITNIHRRALKT
jgi:hypothetical protein